MWENPIRFDPSASDYQKAVFEVALAVGIAVLILVNLPYQQVPVLVEGEYVGSPQEFPLDVLSMERPSKAGWPLSFYTGHTFGSSTTIGNWSLLTMLFDLIVAGGLLLAVGLYFWPRRQSLRRANRWKRKAAYAVATSAAGMGVLAYLALLHLQYNADLSATQVLRQRGTVVRMAFLPQIVARITPEFIARSRLRIVSASLQMPDDQLLDLALDQSELRSLRLIEGSYDQSALQRLGDYRYLQDLSIRDHGLAPETLASWESCRLVSHLNLTDSHFDDEALSSLALIPRLSHLSLLGTGTSFSEITLPENGLNKGIEELILSCPEGEGGLLSLANFYALRRLALLARPRQVNSNPVGISAPELPLLEAIVVSPNQLIDFTGSNLPVFSGLYPLAEIDLPRALQIGRPASQGRPAHDVTNGVWLQNFKLRGCATRSLVFDAKSIGNFAITDCENLERLTFLGSAANAAEDATRDPIDLSVRQRLMFSIGEIGGPENLGLVGMKLSDLNLLPLTYNVEIHNLDLSNAIIDLDGIKTLEEMRLIRGLNLTNVPLAAEAFPWINGAFVNLEDLTVSPDYARRFVFEKHKNLRRLRLGDFQRRMIDEIELTDLKNFETPITVSDQATAVKLQDLPSLEGLGIPSPCECEIDDVPGLKWFASGGSNCTDHTVQQVLGADGLTRLSIVYPVAGKDAFVSLNRLGSLRQANLAGCPLDDDFFASCDIPPTLQTLVLDDCPISNEMVLNLLSNVQLEGLSIARTEIDSYSIEEFSKLDRLKALGLAGLRLYDEDKEENKALDKLAKLPQLKHLDLSDTQLPPDAVDTLVLFPALEQINLSGSSLTTADVEKLRLAKPELHIAEDLTSWDFIQAIHGDASQDELSPGFAMPRLDGKRFKQSRDDAGLATSGGQ